MKQHDELQLLGGWLHWVVAVLKRAYLVMLLLKKTILLKSLNMI